MKKFFLLVSVLIGVVVLVAVGPTFAAGIKIGMIDMQKIMRESEAAKDARGMLLMDIESKRNVLKERELKVRKMEEELKTKEKVLSLSAKEKKNDEFLEAVKELKILRDGMEEELKKKEAKLLIRLAREIKEIAEKILKKEDLSIVLEKKAVIIPGDAIDVTDEVIKIYDEKKK